MIGHNEFHENAIILDPWLNIVFSLEEFKRHMKYNIFNVPSIDIQVRKKFSLKDFII
jgi:hypothetical protein